MFYSLELRVESLELVESLEFRVVCDSLEIVSWYSEEKLLTVYQLTNYSQLYTLNPQLKN